MKDWDLDYDDEREPRPGVGGFGPRPATLAGSGGTDPDRARALDRRDPDKLAVIAADMECENRPSVDELMRERYGRRPPRRRSA